MKERCLIPGCRLINFPTHLDDCVLTVVEGRILPFKIKRVFYTSDVEMFSKRGKHALKRCQQVIVPVSGSFRVWLDNGREKDYITLVTVSLGLYIAPMVWRVLDRFSVDAVALVFASEEYDPDDYYRDKDEWRKALADQSS